MTIEAAEEHVFSEEEVKRGKVVARRNKNIKRMMRIASKQYKKQPMITQDIVIKIQAEDQRPNDCRTKR